MSVDATWGSSEGAGGVSLACFFCSVTGALPSLSPIISDVNQQRLSVYSFKEAFPLVCEANVTFVGQTLAMTALKQDSCESRAC